MEEKTEVIIEAEESLPPVKKERPDIISDVDKPFDKEYNGPTTLEIKEQEHGHGVEDFKNKVSSWIVFGGLVVIIVITAAEVLIAKNYDALEKTFEFVKTMVTMSLGFLLADNKKK